MWTDGNSWQDWNWNITLTFSVSHTAINNNYALISEFEKQPSNIGKELVLISLLVYHKQNYSFKNKTKFTYENPQTGISGHNIKSLPFKFQKQNYTPEYCYHLTFACILLVCVKQEETIRKPWIKITLPYIIEQHHPRTSQNMQTLEPHVQLHTYVWYIRESDGQKVGIVCRIIQFIQVSANVCEMINIITPTTDVVLPQASSANNWAIQFGSKKEQKEKWTKLVSHHSRWESEEALSWNFNLEEWWLKY